MEERVYQLIGESKRSGKKKEKKDRLMRDTKDHFIVMMNAAQGVMGYWDKGRQAQVYTLELTTDRNRITVGITRDEGKGKDKKPNDLLFSILVALIVGAISFGLFWFLIKASPVVCGIMTAVLCIAAFFLVRFTYRQEERRFYQLLDRYMKEIRRAEPVRR